MRTYLHAISIVMPMPKAVAG